MTRAAWLAAWLVLGACDQGTTTRVRHRDNCNVCHQPLDDRGHPTGIEDIHPWRPLGCAECHGGNPRICDGAIGGTTEDPTCDGLWIYDKTLAHPPAGPALEGLSPAELDAVDPAWLRFVNPSDVRVLSLTCGRCHTDVAARVRRSDHALQTGDLAIGRARAGLQATTTPRFGVMPALDPSPDPTDPCTATAVTRFSPLPLDPTSTDPRTAPSPANVIDQLLAKACVGCHVSATSRATQDTPSGAHRGAGCAACHVPYAPDGRSVSADPWVDRLAAGHPLQHVMESSPRMSTCLACHGGDDPAAGAQIGRSYQGLPPVGVPAPSTPTPTPADVHFAAGMGCVDCHHAELHGDGRIGGDATCADPIVACEDCHGSRTTPATLTGSRHRLSTRGEAIVLTTTTGRELEVPQLARASPDTPDAYDPHAASHDVLACSTCHAGWMPSCYGCHIEVDLSLSAPYLTTGVIVPGVITTEVLGFETDTQILAMNARGEIQGAMPAEHVVVTVKDGALVHVDAAPRTGPGGAVARGLRPIDPHTTQRASPLSSCDRCHATGSVAAPDNLERLDLTHGFGSDRHVRDGVRMDAALLPDGTPLVVPAHAGVRPLMLEEIAKMRAVLVPDPVAPSP